MTAEELQEAMSKAQGLRFGPTLDGYFLSKPLAAIYEAGEQAKIPLLAGSNTQEQAPRSVLGDGEPTPETLESAIKRFYGDSAQEILKAYTAATTDELCANPGAASERTITDVRINRFMCLFSRVMLFVWAVLSGRDFRR